MSRATRISLDVWQDPQGDVVFEWSGAGCRAYFECWAEPGVGADYLAEVTFHRPLAVRGQRSEFPPYASSGDVGPSYLLEVPDSGWLAELRTRQEQIYGDRATALDPQFRHLVVVGHDNSVEVLCTGFDLRRVSPEEVAHVRFS